MLFPKVSVHMITYNHEEFIGQALESALGQVTDFPFEIVVGEDASSDRTREIVKQYAARHPERIRVLLRETNIGMRQNYVDTMRACRGEYIAFLEGDDFWTSPLKLQKQYDVLDADPKYAICSHNVVVVAANIRTEKFTTASSPHRDGTIEDVIRYRYPMPTCGIMIRNLLRDFPEWFARIDNLDYATQLLVARHGMVRFLDEPMGVYRKHGGGVSEVTPARRRFESFVYLLCAANAEFDFQYDRLFRQRLAATYRSAAMHDLRHRRVGGFVNLMARSLLYATTSRLS
jgi:glycosyltransferase involved in cell wall biosynthesis